MNVLSRYQTYIVSDYVRKGYQPVMKKGEHQAEDNKTYVRLLSELRGEDSER